MALTKQNIEVFTKNLEEFTENAGKAADALTVATNKKDEADSIRISLENDIENLKSAISTLEIEIEHELEEQSRISERQNSINMRLAELEGTASSTDERKSELQKELQNTKNSTALFGKNSLNSL